MLIIGQNIEVWVEHCPSGVITSCILYCWARFSISILVVVSVLFILRVGTGRVGGVNSATVQDSSVICLGVVHMEGRVQVRVQVEVGREKVGEGETHGESQDEEATRNKRSTAHYGWHEYGVMRACRHLSHAVSMHIITACEVHVKNDV